MSQEWSIVKITCGHAFSKRVTKQKLDLPKKGRLD